jgi:hypothetical protein
MTVLVLQRFQIACAPRGASCAQPARVRWHMYFHVRVPTGTLCVGARRILWRIIYMSSFFTYEVKGRHASTTRVSPARFRSLLVTPRLLELMLISFYTHVSCYILKILISLFSMGWFLHRTVAFLLEKTNGNASFWCKNHPLVNILFYCLFR